MDKENKPNVCIVRRPGHDSFFCFLCIDKFSFAIVSSLSSYYYLFHCREVGFVGFASLRYEIYFIHLMDISFQRRDAFHSFADAIVLIDGVEGICHQTKAILQ